MCNQGEIRSLALVEQKVRTAANAPVTRVCKWGEFDRNEDTRQSCCAWLPRHSFKDHDPKRICNDVKGDERPPTQVVDCVAKLELQ